PSSAGALASQARAYENLREFFTSATMAALIDLPFVFVFAFIVFLLGGPVALPMAVGASLVIFVALVLQIPLARSVEKSYRASTQRHALFVESINALETVKASRAESTLQSRMEECVSISAKAEGDSRWYSQMALNMTAFIQHGVTIFTLITAVYLIMGGALTMGAMVASVILVGRGMAPLAMAASLLTRLQQSRRALRGLNEIMNLPREREDGSPRTTVTRFDARVDVENLSFSYPESPELRTLNDLNFSIQPGERVGVLGRVGSGKSTLLRMMIELYHPTEGRIDVSGIDLRQLDPSTLRRNIAYMSQDPTLLYGTLRQNLNVACPWIDEDQLWKALERAGLTNFVRSHPKGLDMPIGEVGRSLSGGQRQAICLARCLVQEPQLLIFDEPASSMDSESEKALIRSIKRYLDQDRSRSLILATHRSSMLKLVDRVIVLDQGKISVDGRKESVVKNSTPQQTGLKKAA
ncbi:MAG: ATP-binding cassette domain-containing protein, partial [Verrucomicrobiota bacterium]